MEDTYNTNGRVTTIFLALVVIRSYLEPMKIEDVLAKTWWTTEDTATYLGKTLSATRQFMRRAGVKRSNADKRLTCRVWVDKALSR